MSKKHTNKKCQYCAEEISKEARFCKHCHQKQEEWTFPLLSRWTLTVVQFLGVSLLSLVPVAAWLIFDIEYSNNSRLLDGLLRAIEYSVYCLGGIILLMTVSSVSDITLPAGYFSTKSSIELTEDKNEAKSFLKLYLKIAVFLAISIMLLGISKPRKSNHVSHLEQHTSYSEYEIVQFYENAIFSASLVSSEEGDIVYCGMANKVFKMWTKK